MDSFSTIRSKVVKTLKDEGAISVGKKAISYINTKRVLRRAGKSTFKDVLFINGCDYNALPHPPRYRVQHQMEQLKANGIECDEVFHMVLDMNLVRNYRTFVIFRCPYSEKIGKFIELAKSLNKTVIYDIDDLVIDTKYTDTIKFLDTLSKEDREGYDQGVMAMQKTLRMCDAAITTTERLAEELKKYCPKVYINRNTASEEMLELSENAYKEKQDIRDCSKIKMGYFSGSISHNDDFVLIMPTIAKIMEEFTNTELHIVGILDIPKELEAFSERIVAHEFTDWKNLPKLITSMDINLAPLEEGIFNEAKSENKWVEAGLVRVPTVASKVGAFERMIENGVTGLLCSSDEEWYTALKQLIMEPEKRNSIAENAYAYCKQNCVTLYTGFGLAQFLKSMFAPNVAFVVPALNISGGIMVAFEHCKILHEAGYDVTIINEDLDNREWQEFQEIKFPVLPRKDYHFPGSFDKAVATMWFTTEFLENVPNIRKRYYLVQGLETNFYEPNSPFRIQANSKYSPKVDMQFLTISKWCESWLEKDYNQKARYVPNAIHAEKFKPKKREFKGKIRILIEGDCGVYYKNVDESFKIANQLDRDKFEVWYLSYNANPKEWYKVDRFLHKVPFEQVVDVYHQCHILLKTSFLESFSYPPLEMMATGGYAVVVPNDGNKEYLCHEENCLFYPQGKIEEGLNAIYRICEDAKLREKLYEGGIRTAQSRDWDALREDILEFYK